MRPTLVSRVGLVLSVLAIVALIFTHSLFGENGAAIFLQAASLALMIWARMTFGSRSFHASADPTAGGLVTSGPYRYLRHPIYASVIYFVWVGVLSHLSIASFLLGGAAVAGFVLRIRAEEHLVVERYPAYADYAHRTKRIIPFLL